MRRFGFTNQLVHIYSFTNNMLTKNLKKCYSITPQWSTALNISNVQETRHFLGFSTIKVILQLSQIHVSVLTFCPVLCTTSYELLQQQQFKKWCYLWRKAKLRLLYAPLFLGNKRKHGSVGSKRSHASDILMIMNCFELGYCYVDANQPR